MYSPASRLTWIHVTGLSSNRSDPLRGQENTDHREQCSSWQEPKTRQAPAEGMKGGNWFKAGGISGSRKKETIPSLSTPRSIYQKFREVDLLDKKKTVTALKPGEDRAILLGLGMILSSVMLYFVLGITILRSYAERYRPAISFSRNQCQELATGLLYCPRFLSCTKSDFLWNVHTACGRRRVCASYSTPRSRRT